MGNSGTKPGTKLKFDGERYSAEALRKAVVTRGATLTELDLR